MGVGKSATARALGKKLGWCVLDKDDASDVLIGRLEPHGKYAYEIMYAYAECMLLQGFNVIVDSPMRSDIGYLKAVAFADKHDITIKVLELYCSNEKEWANRLETRLRRKAHVIKEWQDFESYWQKAEKDFNYEINHPCLKVDTYEAIEDNIEKIVDFLEN